MTVFEPPTEVMEASDSLVGQLRMAAAEQQKEHVEDFLVGGEFKKQLWIRYKPLDPGPMDRFFARRSEVMGNLAGLKGELPITELNMDLMAQACVGIVGADINGNNKEVLEDEDGPLTHLDYRVTEYLHIPWDGLDRPTSRDVIMALFGQNAMAIIDHGDDLAGWMRDPSQKPNVGES
jgi:hypothetical protein